MKAASYKADRQVALMTVNELGLPTDLDFDQLLEIVQTSLGRTLQVKRSQALAHTLECGHTYRTTQRDVILHAPSESRYQELYWICHELGHLLLGHLDETVPEAVSPALGQVFDLLDQSMLAEQLARTVRPAEPAPAPSHLDLEDGEVILGEVRRCLLRDPGERLAEAVADKLYMRLHKASKLRLTEPGEFGSIFG